MHMHTIIPVKLSNIIIVVRRSARSAGVTPGGSWYGGGGAGPKSVGPGANAGAGAGACAAVNVNKKITIKQVKIFL